MLPLTLPAIAISGLAAMAAVMTIAWLIEQRSGHSGWIDACWTFGVGVVSVAASLWAASGHDHPARPILVAALIGFWSLRLGWHIVGRTRAGGDDPRYAKMRADWGDEAPQRMFWLLQIQALASVPLIVAVAVAASNESRNVGVQDLLAALIFAGAIIGESVSDAQLRAFVRDPAKRGHVCRTGLWRWSRHPNYFFEWLVWVALPLFAINIDGSHPWGWLALGAPAVMYWLLTSVSGVPLLEEHMVGKYGAAYRDYQKTTSAFFPWPPRR